MRKITQPTKRTLACLLLLVSLAFPCAALAVEDSSAPAESFPGLNEVVPQATAVAARIAETEAEVQQADELQGVYDLLDEQTDNLQQLEENYQDWDQATNWPLNRLLAAQASYADLSEQQQEPLNTIYTHLQTLDSSRSYWTREKIYWREWKEYFQKSNIRAPSEAFERTLNSIDALINKLTRTGGILVKAQQKYSPGQEVIASRLSLIDNTLDHLRRDSFRRNTFALYETDFYRQFNREIFAEFIRDLSTSLRLPDNFFDRYSGINTLHLIGIITVLLLLLYRKRQQKTLNEEWLFLYRRPLSGAIFITLVTLRLLGEFYVNTPPSWQFLIVVVVTIAAIRLLNAIYQQRFARNFVRIVAILFICSVAFQAFGVPAPLLQLLQSVISIIAIPICLLQVRKHRQEMFRKHLFAMYVLCIMAVLVAITAVLGFSTLSTNLIDATLSTFILIILVQMALRMINGGIQSFMSLEWVKSRQFMKTLGVEVAARKLKILLRIIVLVNTGLYLLVVWKIFDNLQDARSYLLSREYAFGEFSISIEMVLMIVIVLYLTTLFSWVIQAFLDSQVMTPKNMDRGVKESLKRLTHYGLFSVGFLTAVGMAGLDLQKFTILAGALGVGIGFGLQNIVSNFVSGLILLFERPVKVGDTINIGEDWGTISRIGLRSTVFETFDRSEIIVPNADLISKNVTNWTFSSKMVRVQLPVGVAYGSPLDVVLKILNRAALEHKEVLSYPEPTAVFVGFGNSSIDFTLRFWVYSIDDRMRIRTDVAVIIDRLFREEGITIPFPQQDLHLRSVEEDLQPLFGKKSGGNRPEEKAEDEGTPL